MGKMVEEAIKENKLKTDEDLMKKYATNILSPYPSTVEITSIRESFLERGITCLGVETTVKFQRKDGTVTPYHFTSGK